MDKIIGTSLSNLKKIVAQFSKEGKNILLIGSTGTGKELFAQLYQEESGRDKFAPVNCSGISDTVLSSELFGHVKGSFTDALDDRKGILSEYSKNGVIFFDEIGGASLSFQTAILRVLETGDYKPVGSDDFKNINNLNDLRIIAATSSKENLRQDLLYRFHPLYIPDLADRKEDIPELIEHFCKSLQTKYISQKALNYLKDWYWGGNVRELKAVLEQASFLSKKAGDSIIKCNHFHSIYFDSDQDESTKTSVSNLPSKSTPYDYKHFFIDPQTSEINSRLSLIEARTRTFFDDKTWGPIEESLLQRERDSILISILKEIKPMVKRVIGDLNKAPSSRITFENTIPEEYKTLFWEHHAKKNRGGTEIEKLFSGKINKKTAQRNLNKAKKQ